MMTADACVVTGRADGWLKERIRAVSGEWDCEKDFFQLYTSFKNWKRITTEVRFFLKVPHKNAQITFTDL